MSSFPFPEFPSESTENWVLTGPVNDENLLFTTVQPSASSSMINNPDFTSPSANNTDTPADSVALSLHYQSSSDFGDPDADTNDDYFNETVWSSVGGNAPSFLTEAAANLDSLLDAAATSLSAGTTPAVAASTDLADGLLTGLVTGATLGTPEQRSLGLAGSNNSSYPISPDQTPSLYPSSPPARSLGQHAQATIAAQKLAAHTTAFPFSSTEPFSASVSPQLLTKQPLTVPAPLPLSFDLTPDTASSGGGSLSTEEGLTPAQTDPKLMSGPHPHVTVSLWGKDSNTESHSASRVVPPGASADDSALPPPSASVPRTAHGAWVPDAASGARGIDPASRTGAEVPSSINEDAERRKVEERNAGVSEWLHTAQGVEPDVAGPPQQNETDFDGVSSRAIEFGNNTRNTPQPGRTYFTETGGPMTQTDYDLMRQGHVWTDAPTVLPIRQNDFQPQQPKTSQAAIEQFERLCHDNASFVSRAATWGTRRLSLPSIADFEGITSGNFLKKLAISRDNTPRRSSILGGLRTLVRKPSSASQHAKRSRSGQDDEIASNIDAYDTGYNSFEEPRRDSKSSNTLAPPSRTQSWGKSKQTTPSINTALVSIGKNAAAIGTTHARKGSVSVSPPPTSPKSPLLKVTNSLRRPRSKSEFSKTPSDHHPNLVRMLMKAGGPPVLSTTTPAPASSPSMTVTVAGGALAVPSPPPITIPAGSAAVVDPEEEEDDDDEGLEDGDLKDESDEVIDKITPDLDGFRQLVLELNPMLREANTYLVDRIAHQQIMRYKGLLNNKVKHLGLVRAQKCPSGPRCIEQGGSSLLLDSKGEPRCGDPLSSSPYDGQDDDLVSPLEGVIDADKFPKYIPLPPARTLPAEFECQLCFVNKRLQKPSDWTKHVHEDVHPFTCTWDRCRDPKIFKRKADWVRHENEGHRHLEWWTCDVEECRHVCYRRDNFLQHLVREHKFPEPKHKTKAAIKRAGATDETLNRVELCHKETTKRPQEEPCRFCNKTFPTWKKLTVHLAKHMEHISLPLLRLVEKKEVEADTLISPVRDPPPRTFAPPITLPATAGPNYGMMVGMPGPSIPGNVQPMFSGGMHQSIPQSMAYGPPPSHGQPTYVYTTSPIPYQTPNFYSPSQFAAPTGMANQMQSMDAATMDAATMDVRQLGPVFANGPTYGHGNPGALPVTTTASYLMQAPTQFVSGPPNPSAYSSMPTVDALGLQGGGLSGGSMPYEAMMVPGVSSGDEHFTPHGSVSPYGHSPHQPQGQFYAQ